MSVIPCELCGYDAPSAVCSHCGGASTDASFAAARAGDSGLRAGLSALPRGLGYLSTTRGTKRWLVPPFVITTLAFGVLMVWAWDGFASLVEHAHEVANRTQPIDAGWWQRALEFVIESWLFVVIAKLTGLFLFLVIGFFAALYTFSLFYEAISGPFLDEVQGRIEKRWFGVDPRNAIQRPTSMPVSRCIQLCVAAGALAALCVFGAWQISGALRWWAIIAAATFPFAALGWLVRDWGRWFVWALRIQISTLWTSVRTSLFALALLILCLPLKFVPLIGPFLFAAAAGFATSISLLDIPFSRRGWSFGQRLAFLSHHLPALLAFGTVASLVFLIPFAGPILMVPAASIGGQWLVVRLDKSKLRRNSQLRAARLAARIGSPG
jgi:uncharacterized protein involved in cysteine biosynthesis